MKILLNISLASLALTSCGGLGSKCLGETITEQIATLSTRSVGTAGQMVEFCVGGSRPKKVSLEITEGSSSDAQTLVLGSDYSDNDLGTHHWDGACNDMDRSQHPTHVIEKVPLALTSTSFGKIKLCYYDSNKTTIALSTIAENQDCPVGSVSQMAAVDDCSTMLASQQATK